jgi:hypothetical protein
MTMAQSPSASGLTRRRDEDHVRSLKEALLWEIGLAQEQRGISDAAAAEITGQGIETLKDALRGRRAAYGIVRLMRALARLGVPVSLSVTPTSTMLRAGERRQVIRYRRDRSPG